MIYEVTVVATTESGEAGVKKVEQIVNEVVSAQNGEVLLTDVWGTKTFAQQTATGAKTGQFVYMLVKADGNAVNTEILRRFKIEESIMRNLILVAGKDSEQEEILKNYKTPFSKQFGGSQTDAIDEGDKKDRRRLAKRRTCWFTAKKISADWKDPATYSWLINEFGKISPARVSGVSMKHHRLANTAIKRGRQLGIVSYVSNKVLA